MSVLTTRQAINCRPIAAQHGLLFLPSPAFDPLFGTEGFLTGSIFLCKYSCKRTTGRSIAAKCSSMMLIYAVF